MLIDPHSSFTEEQQAEILAAHDQHQLTGGDAPILLKPHVTPPAPADPPALEQSAATSVEPAARPNEEREWDTVEGRYRDRPAAEAESARLNAARETWELPVPPVTPQHPAPPDKDNLAT